MPIIDPRLLDQFRVAPGTHVRLADLDPGYLGPPALRELGKGEVKNRAKQLLEQSRDELEEMQELFWAADTYALLVIFQAIDAAGKDGTIKHVMSGLNPQVCHVTGFKQPSAEELDHDFLWRYWRALPERGRIGVFNRSYYEEVLVVRVRPELLVPQKLPPGDRGPTFWAERMEDINDYERHLARSGTRILKFFLHLSKEEQRQRLLARLDEPDKHWKFSLGDLDDRARWDDYMRAYEDAISATSSAHAPWYIIPADHKFVTRALVAAIIAREIRDLGLSYPAVSDAQRAALREARKRLEAERP